MGAYFRCVQFLGVKGLFDLVCGQTDNSPAESLRGQFFIADLRSFAEQFALYIHFLWGGSIVYFTLYYHKFNSI
jgi:hypothetical protein